MATKPYFDRVLSASETKRTLTQVSAKPSTRSTSTASVYVVAGGGEAMVERANGGMYRVRFYKGKCPC